MDFMPRFISNCSCFKYVFLQDVNEKKRQNFLDAVDQDRLLVYEEVDYQGWLVHESKESLREEAAELERNGRRGLQLVAERRRLMRERVSCDDICDEAEETEEKMCAVRSKLRQDISEHDENIEKLEKENYRTSFEIEEAVAKIGKAANLCIGTGRHCGHRNEKQPIQRMLQIEQDNVHYRKENMELQNEVRRLTKLNIIQKS